MLRFILLLLDFGGIFFVIIELYKLKKQPLYLHTHTGLSIVDGMVPAGNKVQSHSLCFSDDSCPPRRRWLSFHTHFLIQGRTSPQNVQTTVIPTMHRPRVPNVLPYTQSMPDICVVQ